MAIIKKFASFQNLSNFQVFEIDKEPNSAYFRITELESTLTGGKNGFLIESSEYLKETTEVKIRIMKKMVDSLDISYYLSVEKYLLN